MSKREKIQEYVLKPKRKLNVLERKKVVLIPTLLHFGCVEILLLQVRIILLLDLYQS